VGSDNLLSCYLLFVCSLLHFNVDAMQASTQSTQCLLCADGHGMPGIQLHLNLASLHAAPNLQPAGTAAVVAVSAGDDGVALKLSYCRDILQGPYARWALKEVIGAFLSDRPLTPDEFDALRGRHAPPKQQQQEEDEGRRRGRHSSR
jgi:hypothetical protein